MNKLMDIIKENFEQCCRRGDYSDIQKQISVYPDLVHCDDGYYFELICDKGDINLIKLFVENGADVFVDNNYPLYTCIYHEYYDCVEYLLNNGCDINIAKHYCGFDKMLKSNKIYAK